jgi:hypothetical protein
MIGVEQTAELTSLPRDLYSQRATQRPSRTAQSIELMWADYSRF